MRKKITITVLLFIFMISASAQNETSHTEMDINTTHSSVKQENNPVLVAFSDSLNHLKASFYAHFRMWEDKEIPAPRHIRINSDYYKLFIPPTYFKSSIEQAHQFDWYPGKKLGMTMVDSLYQALSDTLPKFEVPQITSSVEVDKWVNRILLNYYMQHPDRVEGNERNWQGLKAFDESRIPDAPRKEKVKKHMKAPRPMDDNVDSNNELVVLKPNFWKKSGRTKLQFSQHGISDNWYKGGESTNALIGELKLTANYDDKQRVRFDNSLEIKLGFITAPSDTIHEYKTNADLFRLNSKLGIRAVKNLYYSLAAEFKTQFFSNYKTNSNDLISNFLSPAQLDLSLGMDYKLDKKKYNLSVMGSPFSYTFVYINDEKIYDRGAFNVDPDKTTANMFGSKITANLEWKLASNISWTSKFDYFTTYDKVIADWENTLKFKVSRYLSADIFLHARFDDGVTLNEDNDSYFQFKEMLTFGLSYDF